MKLIYFALSGALTLVVLSGARCSVAQDTDLPSVSQAAITTGLKQNNEPANQVEVIAAGTAVIYVSAEISRPTNDTTATVTWLKVPNQVIATESFDGRRGDSAIQSRDFDRNYPTSWLASQVNRPGASWALGEYQAEIRIDDRLAKTVFFTVVQDSQLDQTMAQRVVQRIRTGDALTDDNHLANTKTVFQPTTDNIYIQLGLTDELPGAKLQVDIRHLKTGAAIDSFTSVTNTDLEPVFTLSRARYRNLWPTGAYEITAKINGTVGRTISFTVQG